MRMEINICETSDHQVDNNEIKVRPPGLKILLYIKRD